MLNRPFLHRQPWSLHTWPPVLWQAGRRLPSRLKHLGTQVHRQGHGQSGLTGQTLWAFRGRDGEAGLAWDWVQIADGVVALADPMAIVTNLRLVGEEGDALTRAESALHINALVHGLNWQPEVARAIGGSAVAAEPDMLLQ